MRKLILLLVAVSLFGQVPRGGPGGASPPPVRAGVYQAYCTGTATSSTTVFLPGFGGSATGCTTTTAAGAMPVTSSGTIKNLVVQLGTGGKSGDAVTLQKGGSAQGVTCTFGTGTSCTDTTHSFTVAAQDQIRIAITTGATDTAANISVSFEIWN